MSRREIVKNGKSKMTVMMFQLEGSDETLQDGIRTIGEAMGNFMKPARLAFANPLPGLPTDVRDDNKEQADVDLESAVESREDNDIQQDGSTAKAPRSYRSPEVLTLDLAKGPVALKDFCESKSAGDNDNKRTLVIAYWLKENLGIEEITANHVYTCYRFMGWSTQRDVAAPLRSMKTQGFFSKGGGKGGYKINHVGENKVREMKPV